MQHSSQPSLAKREIQLFSTLVRSVPKLVIVLFSFVVIAMNLLSSFTIVNTPYLALTAGVFVSWAAFMIMDVVNKRFGPKAANRLSWIALSANLVAVAIFFIISQIGTIPELDMVLHGQWSVLLASSIAFVTSALVNNFMNHLIGRAFQNRPDSKAAYFTRTYISTFIGQYIDNFVFISLAFIVFPLIPGALPVTWTITQCAICSLTCAVVELALEMLFSPIGYRIARKWKEKGVGQEYVDAYYPEEKTETV